MWKEEQLARTEYAKLQQSDPPCIAFDGVTLGSKVGSKSSRMGIDFPILEQSFPFVSC
jgi:hypothetical protein